MTRASQYLTSPNILRWGTAADERLITITFDQIKHIGQPLLLPSTSFCAKDGQGRSARAKPYSVFNSSSSLSCSSLSSFSSSYSFFSSFCYSSSCDSILTRMIMANVCHHQPVTFKQWSDSTSLRCCSVLLNVHFSNQTFHQQIISTCVVPAMYYGWDNLHFANCFLYKYRSANTRKTTLAAAQFSSVTMNRSSSEQGSHGRKRKESLASEDRIWQTQEMKSRNTKFKRQKHKQGRRILQLNKYWLLRWVFIMSWVEFTRVQFNFNLRSVN